MLAIEKQHWYSWDFTVSQAGRRIAEIGLSWRERGRLTVNGLGGIGGVLLSTGHK